MRIRILMGALLALALIVAGLVPSAVATNPPNEGVCTGLDSGKIDTPGAGSTLTIYAPPGKLISGYCVKAGSINQGDGPEYVTVTPAASVTISHSSGKTISHYSASYTTVQPTEVSASVTFRNPTCENPTAGYTTGPTTGVKYTLTSGTVGPGNTVTVTATAKDGFVLTGQSVFTHTFDQVPEDCGPGEEPIEVTAGVTFREPTCANPTAGVTTSTVTGVSYSTTGTVAPGETVTVTATAAEGYELVGQSVFTHTFSAAPTNCDTPPPPRCPPGEFPTDGKDGEPGNEECEPPPTTPPLTTPPVVPPTTAVTPPPPPPVVSSTGPVSNPKPKAKAKPKPKAKPKAVPKPDKPPVAKKHVCKTIVYTDSNGKVWKTPRVWMKGRGCVGAIRGSG